MVKRKLRSKDNPYAAPSGQDSVRDFVYEYASETADADPGAGKIRFDNATPGSATGVYINDVDKEGVDRSVLLAALASGDRVMVSLRNQADQAVLCTLSATADDGGYWDLTCVTTGSFSPSAGDEVLVSVL